MDFVSIIFGILFSVFGLMFSFGKIHVHLSAWKNMPDDEKNEIRIEPLCLNIGEVIAGAGILFLINGLFPGFKSHWFEISIILWLVVAFFDVMYITKSKHYYKNK